MNGAIATAPAVQRAGRLVGASQILFGLALVASPDRTARTFGVVPEQPWIRWFARLYGVRDIATGIGLFHAASKPGEARAWLAMEGAIQAFDAVATAFALRSGALPKRAALPVIAIAPLWVALCVAGMSEARARADIG